MDELLDAAAEVVKARKPGESNGIKFARFMCCAVAAFVAEALATKAFDTVLASRQSSSTVESSTEEES